MPETAVSVVIPLYNKEKSIERCLNSIISQTFADFEIIIVNDGSSDKSVEIVAGFSDPRLTLIHQENKGPGAARNRGVAAARSPLIAFIDADDEWDADHLAIAVARLTAQQDAAAHICGYYIGPAKESREDLNRSRGIVPGAAPILAHRDPVGLKFLVDFMHSSCIVCRRDVVLSYGGYYDAFKCLYGEDSYLWLQILFAETVLFDPVPHVWFHTEFSDLGAKNMGRHPTRPALTDPAPLRRAVPAAQQRNLACLLALYRLIETEKLVRSGDGTLGRIRELRAQFPWPDAPPARIRYREARVSAKAALAPLRHALSHWLR